MVSLNITGTHNSSAEHGEFYEINRHLSWSHSKGKLKFETQLSSDQLTLFFCCIFGMIHPSQLYKRLVRRYDGGPPKTYRSNTVKTSGGMTGRLGIRILEHEALRFHGNHVRCNGFSRWQAVAPVGGQRCLTWHLVKLAGDLTRPISPKWWWKVREMGPLISGKSRLVKYYNLARWHPWN